MTRGAGLLCLSPLEDASLPPQGRAYQRNPWMPQARTKKDRSVCARRFLRFSHLPRGAKMFESPASANEAG